MYYLPQLSSSGGGGVVQQAPHVNTLILVLQSRASLSALGEEFLVTTETADNLFQYDSYAYAFCLRRHVMTPDVQDVVKSLQAAWVQARPGE